MKSPFEKCIAFEILYFLVVFIKRITIPYYFSAAFMNVVKMTFTKRD